MGIPLTGLSTLTGVIVMSAAWIFVGRRIAASKLTVSRPIQMMRKFFLFMGIFFMLMGLPHILLYTDPSGFPQAMAWGYTVGHIFMYIAFAYIARLIFIIVPQLMPKNA